MNEKDVCEPSSYRLLFCSAARRYWHKEIWKSATKALARRFYGQVWFSRNLHVVDELVAPTYIVHDIGDRKGLTEPAEEQKRIADFFGSMAR